MSLKAALKEWVPPALLRAVRRLRAPEGPPDWEYVPEGWRTQDPRVQGWNVESIVRAQQRSWPAFVHLASGTGPLGINHTDLEPRADNPGAHNTVMAFAYALALAAGGRDRVSILDWGGGLGHYAVLARSLLPGVAVGYTCKDLPLLCAAGRQVLPDDTFLESDEEIRGRTFDLVLSSSSLHYVEDWRSALALLAGATGRYLYVTRLPVVAQAPSFVVVQRPYACGYETEYLGWFLNRAELLEHARGLGLELLREVLIEERPEVHGAPEPGEYRGFLFRPVR